MIAPCPLPPTMDPLLDSYRINRRKRRSSPYKTRTARGWCFFFFSVFTKGCQKSLGGRQGDACRVLGHGLAARVPPFRWAGFGPALPYPCNHRKRRRERVRVRAAVILYGSRSVAVTRRDYKECRPYTLLLLLLLLLLSFTIGFNLVSECINMNKYLMFRNRFFSGLNL